MHPRAQATSPTGTPGPGHSNGFLRLSKLPFASPQTLQNSPKLSKRSKPSKTRQTLQTPSPAGTSDPQQWLSMGLKAAVCQPAKDPNFQNSKPPGPGPQQWDFLWAFKAPVCQPAKAPNFPKQNSKHLPQQAPQGQGHFPNRHPRARAKATSPTGTPGPGHSNAFYGLSKLPFASPQTLQSPPKFQTPRARATAMRLFMGFQSYRLPARKPSKTLQTLQTLQNPPNPPNTVPSRHPRSTAMTSNHLPSVHGMILQA